jgi:drug/metabolite transporter (DMT)-like permease
MQMPKKDGKWIVVRSAAGTLQSFCMLFAIRFLPLGFFTTIYNTTPFWASLMAYFLLRERIHQTEVVAMIFSFTLIFLLAVSRQDQITSGAQNSLWVGLTLAFGSAIGASATAVATRRMQKMHYSVILFNYALVAIVFAIAILAGLYLVNGSFTLLAAGWTTGALCVATGMISALA